MTDELLLGAGVILLAGFIVITMLPWRRWAERWVGNDPHRANIYVEEGEDLHPVPGRLAYESNEAAFYRYLWNGKVAEVLVGPDYPVKYVRGRRVIGVAAGALRATTCPFSGQTDHTYIDVGAVVQGRVMVQLVQAVAGPSRPAWLWLAVGAGGLVALYFLGQQFFPEQVAALVPGSSAPVVPAEAP